MQVVLQARAGGTGGKIARVIIKRIVFGKTDFLLLFSPKCMRVLFCRINVRFLRLISPDMIESKQIELTNSLEEK